MVIPSSFSRTSRKSLQVYYISFILYTQWNTYLLVVWGVNSWLGENTVKDQTDGNTTWDTDESSLFISTTHRGEKGEGRTMAE
jgi:hypothetical protein